MSDPFQILPPDPDPSEAFPDSPSLTQPATQPAGPMAGLRALWRLVARLLILGGSISLGWLAGMLVAQLWPSRNPSPPLPEVVMRQTSQTGRKLRQLPQWWQGDASTGLVTAENAPEPAPTTESGPGAVLPPPPPVLSANQRQRLEDDLIPLQQDLKALEARLTELEINLGQPTFGSIESRLRQLDQRYGQGQATPTPTTGADEAAPRAVVPFPEPAFPVVTDRIVLPTALLFEPGGSVLTAAGEQLLETIVPDLQRYGAVTLLVGSHTDGIQAADGAEQARQLTFQQALSIQRYLQPQFPPEDTRWVTLGYGQTRPRVLDTSAAAQARNQRVEIGIVSP